MASAARPSDPSTQHEDLKPGSPPHHATVPEGSEESGKNPQTRTDPHTGEPNAPA